MKNLGTIFAAAAALTAGLIVFGGSPVQASPIMNASFKTTAAPAAQLELTKFRDYGFSSEQDMENYFTVTQVQVQEIANPSIAEVPPCVPGIAAPAGCAYPQLPGGGSATPAPGIPGSIIGVIADPTGAGPWIALGEKIWQLISAGRPVADVNTKRISVLPLEQSDWAQMENWQGPVTKSFTIDAINYFGMHVVTQTYTLSENYNGQFKGVGHFLANAMIIPSNVTVLWGFKLDSNAEVGHIINTATKEDPTPGLDISVRWKMSSVLKHDEGVQAFFIKGDGTQTLFNQ